MNHEKKIKAPTKKNRPPNTREILDRVEDDDEDDFYREPDDVDEESPPVIISV